MNRFGRIIAKRRHAARVDRQRETFLRHLDQVFSPLAKICAAESAQHPGHACAEPPNHGGDHRCGCGICWDNNSTIAEQLN